MDLDFNNVKVNSTMFNGTMNGTDVFDYVFIGPEDLIPKPGDYSAKRTQIIWTDGNQTVVNQTENWTKYSRLDFNIGTIHIKETWETTFRLRVKQEGIIDLFGPGSTINYNDMPGNLHLPTTLITSVNNTIPLGLQNGSTICYKPCPQVRSFNVSVPMQWNLVIPGSIKSLKHIGIRLEINHLYNLVR